MIFGNGVRPREVRFESYGRGLLGGSWVVISRVISPLIGVIVIVALLITPLITTHEPPSRVYRGFRVSRDADLGQAVRCFRNCACR